MSSQLLSLSQQITLHSTHLVEVGQRHATTFLPPLHASALSSLPQKLVVAVGINRRRRGHSSSSSSTAFLSLSYVHEAAQLTRNV